MNRTKLHFIRSFQLKVTLLLIASLFFIACLSNFLIYRFAYDAMSSPRAYRLALSREKIIEELHKNKGSLFRPKVVDAFIQILDDESKTQT